MEEFKRLTYKQRKAIYLLIACEQSEEEVAEHLGITVGRLKGWQRKPSFAAKLEEKFKQLELIDSKYRVKQNKQILKAVYEELQRRIADGYSLRKMKFGDLSSLIRAFSHETRLDTPDDVTSKTKVEYHILDELSDRFENRKSFYPELKLVELPSVKNKEGKVA